MIKKTYYEAILYDRDATPEDQNVLWSARGDSMAYVRQRIQRDVEVFRPGTILYIKEWIN